MNEYSNVVNEGIETIKSLISVIKEVDLTKINIDKLAEIAFYNDLEGVEALVEYLKTLKEGD